MTEESVSGRQHLAQVKVKLKSNVADLFGCCWWCFIFKVLGSVLKHMTLNSLSFSWNRRDKLLDMINMFHNSSSYIG